MTPDVCSNCRWWMQFADKSIWPTRGTCKRFPPSGVGTFMSVPPSTLTDDTCGEYQERGDPDDFGIVFKESRGSVDPTLDLRAFKWSEADGVSGCETADYRAGMLRAAEIARRFAAAGVYIAEHGLLLGPNTKEAIAFAIEAEANGPR